MSPTAGKFNEGEKVYLLESQITSHGTILEVDQAFFVLAYVPFSDEVDLALVPRGSRILCVKADKITRVKPATTVYDFILEDDP
jgi:hypothetical protein